MNLGHSALSRWGDEVKATGWLLQGEFNADSERTALRDKVAGFRWYVNDQLAYIEIRVCR